MRIKLKISIFLLVFCAALHGTGFSPSVPSIDPNGPQLAQAGQGDEEYTFSSELQVSAKGAEELHINTPNNLGGSINLRVWDEDDCVVKFECWARSNTEKKAKDFVELVDLDLDREENLIQLKLSTPRLAPWEGTNYGIKADLDIFIPKNFTLKTKTLGFDLDICGPLIDLEGERGRVEAETIYSPIYASDISLLGGVNKIQTVYSKIDLEFEEIEDCEVYVKNTYGNIDVKVPEDLSSRLILTVDRGGKIHTTGILITPTVLKKTRLEGICGQGESEIEMDIDGIGKIHLEGK